VDGRRGSRRGAPRGRTLLGSGCSGKRRAAAPSPGIDSPLSALRDVILRGGVDWGRRINDELGGIGSTRNCFELEVECSDERREAVMAELVPGDLHQSGMEGTGGMQVSP
jgi:hypothetical protein